MSTYENPNRDTPKPPPPPPNPPPQPPPPRRETLGAITNPRVGGADAAG